MNDKSVKTIVLSELPKHEKVKYFQFLLDNDINFSKDESGNYLALIKVLNPQFYNDVELQQEKNKEDNIGKISKNPQIDNQQVINNNRVNNIDYRNQVQKVNYNKVSSGNNNSNNIQHPNIRMVNQQINVNVPKQVIKKETTSNDNLKYLKATYPKFYSLLQPLIGIRPKRLNYFQLKYFIEELYSIRFIKDVTVLRNNEKMRMNEADVSDPFPHFIIEFLTNKYLKKPMLDKNTLDILLSADFYKDKSKEIEIFVKFLTEEFDNEDLIFFLFVRSTIEKEMNMMFIEKAREEIKIQYNEDKEFIDTELYLSIKSCLKIAQTIFGTSQEILLNSFMEKVEKNLVSNNIGKNVISASKIIELTLEDYHESRKIYDNSENDKDVLSQNHQNILQNQDPNSEHKNNNMINELHQADERSEKIQNIKSLAFEFIKQRELDAFFQQLMTAYTFEEKDHEKVETILQSIKEKVENKLMLLISYIFNDSKKEFLDCLRIQENNEEVMNLFEHLSELKEEMLNCNEEEIPDNLLEDFAQILLSTQKLVEQINKLVMKNFSTMHSI